MISDNQVRRLRELMAKDDRVAVNAAKVGMDTKTARKYLRDDGLPSELAASHTWRTREDPFAGVWAEVHPFLELNAGLEAKTLFEYLQRANPGRFPDGQLRSFQRGVRRWRALEGPPKEVFFEQVHQPGYLCQSDFTHMHDLGVTIGGEVFDHLLYHFVLTYSNWESGTVCFSESFESLSEGLQTALWELGAVPTVHRTDRMTAAVSHPGREEFTQRYAALLRHYGLEGRESGAAAARERGRRAAPPSVQACGGPGADVAWVGNFASREDYDSFLRHLFAQLNAGRAAKLEEERRELRPLPGARLECFKKVGPIRVSSGSTIRPGITSTRSTAG